MKIGRNDSCSCGSGKKYKKCCFKLEENSESIWKNNFDKLHEEHPQKEKIKEIFYFTYDFMKKNNWSGACHALASIQYVLLNEIGLEPKLCIGVVKSTKYRFDHSWIDLDGKVYDVAIANGLEGEVSKPIMADYNIISLKKSNILYGNNGALDYPANIIKDLTVKDYLDRFLNHPSSEIPKYLKSGLWDLIVSIGSRIDLNLNIEELRDKYENTKRIVL